VLTDQQKEEPAILKNAYVTLTEIETASRGLDLAQPNPFRLRCGAVDASDQTQRPQIATERTGCPGVALMRTNFRAISRHNAPEGGKQKELELKHHRISRDRRVLRNVLMAGAMAAVLAAVGSIRPALAHAHHGQTRADGNHAHHSRISEAGAWRHDQHRRRSMREKLLASPMPSERSIEHSTESGRLFEGSGIASVYGGQHTASGEQMRPGTMTAAHRTLPFGTQVTVLNRRNGRTAVVRINDRGPFVRGRVIDLSPAAARSLGIVGLASVSLTVGGISGGELPQNGKHPDNGEQLPPQSAGPVTDPAVQIVK
jgi:peptidoglycan lytic transglycosylase